MTIPPAVVMCFSVVQPTGNEIPLNTFFSHMGCHKSVIIQTNEEIHHELIENRRVIDIAPKGPQFERPSAPDMLSLSSGDRSPFGFPGSGISGTLPQSTMHARIGLSSGLNQVSEAGRHTLICNQRCQLRGEASLVSKSLRWNKDSDPLCRVASSYLPL